MTVNIDSYQIILEILNSLWNFNGQIINFSASPTPLHVFIPYYLTCRYRISPELKIASQDELSFIKEHFLDKFGSYHSAAEWANIFGGLVSTLLVGANYNSYAAEVGASLFNIATFLVDPEKGEELEFVNGGKLECPFAISLTSGNEEEKDNIFVKYASHNVDKVYTDNNLTREDFTNNRNGKFLASLFDEKFPDGKLIPRPTKSCCPDFKL